MNRILENSLNLIIKIKNNNENFNNAIRLYLKNDVTPEEKTQIITIVGSFLRNYYLIEFIAKNVFESNKMNVICAVGLYYINSAYSKVVTEEEALEFLKEILKNEKITVTNEHISKLKVFIKNRRDKIPVELKEEPLLYFSIKFNLPVWLIHMFENQYSLDKAIKISRILAKMPYQYLLKNPLNKVPADFSSIEKNDFIPVKDGKCYLYNKKNSVRRHPFVKNLYFYPIQLAYLDLLSELEELENGNITFFLGNKNYLYLDVINKYLNKNNNINIGVKNFGENYQLISHIKSAKLPKVYIFQSEEKTLISHLPYKQDIFVYFPETSEFEDIRRSPEYSMNLKPDNLDALIENEEKGIDEIYPLLNEGATFIYCACTINKKETNILIKKALEKYQDLELVKEKQYLPYDKSESVFYYAILRKKEND